MKQQLLLLLSLISPCIFSKAQKPDPKVIDFEKQPSVQWKFKTNAPIFSSPVINDGLVYFGGLDSTVYAIDLASGALKWKFKTNGAIGQPW